MPTNRLALLSLAASALTVFSFCVGVAPIPMTALVCYPAAILTGIIALALGFRALRQIRQTGEPGGWMAWLGIGLGAFSILAVICFTSLTLALFPYLSEFVTQSWKSISQ